MTTSLLPHQRPFVLLPSDCRLDLADPDPHAWTDEDLATGLSRTYRWGGHSRWPLPLSVAQHSLTVMMLRSHDADFTPALTLYELLHDAEEGLIGWDCITPMKPLLGAGFAQLCARLTAAVSTRYELPTLTADQYHCHKRADRLAAACEARHVARWSDDEISNTLGIEYTPLAADPLFLIGFAAWEPWPAHVAARQWLSRLQTTRAACHVLPAVQSLPALCPAPNSRDRVATSSRRLAASGRPAAAACAAARRTPITVQACQCARARPHCSSTASLSATTATCWTRYVGTECGCSAATRRTGSDEAAASGHPRPLVGVVKTDRRHQGSRLFGTNCPGDFVSVWRITDDAGNARLGRLVDVMDLGELTTKLVVTIAVTLDIPALLAGLAKPGARVRLPGTAPTLVSAMVNNARRSRS